MNLLRQPTVPAVDVQVGSTIRSDTHPHVAQPDLWHAHSLELRGSLRLSLTLSFDNPLHTGSKHAKSPSRRLSKGKQHSELNAP